MHNALSDEKLYIEVRIFLSHLLQLSPGISRKQAFHHVQPEGLFAFAADAAACC